MARISRDLDGLEDREILDLVEKVRDDWSGRDDDIARADELRNQAWTIHIPPEWRQTAVPTHTSLPKEIPVRVAGTIASRAPQFSRAVPGHDLEQETSAEAVERFCAGFFRWWNRKGVPAKSAYLYTADVLTHQGGVALGSIFAPHAWAGAPLFMDGDSIKRENWRDSRGRETDREDEVDYEASARAYDKTVDRHRQQLTSKPAVRRRVVEGKHAYPLFTEDGLAAMAIIRKANLLEIGAGGFNIEAFGQSNYADRADELIEIITPNRCRYVYGKRFLEHEDYGTEGLYTGYGFVPYTYRVGLESGSSDHRHFHTPLLSLVDSHIRLIDFLTTMRKHAVHLAGFTSWFIRYDKANDTIELEIRDKDNGKPVKNYQFRTGTIMDFGRGKEVVPFLHPGLNIDVDKLLMFATEEVHRIIPRTLQGQAESSGFNTVQTTVQAKAIFESLFTSMEMLFEDAAEMDMRHINDRLPGPLYLEYEHPQDIGQRKRAKLERIGVSKKDIDDYFNITCSIDRNIDYLSEGTFAMKLMQAGILDEQTAAERAGVQNYFEILNRKARDRVFNSPEMMAPLYQRAVERFGLKKLQAEAVASGRIQIDPMTGVPMVRMPDGRMVAPGRPIGSVPSAQGTAGELLGGENTTAYAGGPNMASTEVAGASGRMGRSPGGRPRATAGLPQAQGVNRPTPASAV